MMTNTMNPENFSTAISERSFFETILDNTCTRLHDKQAQFTVRKLIELDLFLGNIEKELDVLVAIHANQKIDAQRFL